MVSDMTCGSTALPEMTHFPVKHRSESGRHGDGANCPIAHPIQTQKRG
jgi:hypothetical protein